MPQLARLRVVVLYVQMLSAVFNIYYKKYDLIKVQVRLIFMFLK